MLPFNNPNLPQGNMFNPNFNNQNPLLNNLNGANLNNFHGLNPNIQSMAQSNPLGAIQLLAAEIQSNPQLQINLLQQLQSQNLAPSFQQVRMPFLGPNSNQMMGMPIPNGQFLAQNQIFQATQPMFVGNPQLGQNNMGLGFGNAMGTMGHNPVYGAIGTPQMAMMPSSPNKTQWNKNSAGQGIGSQQFQGNHVEAKPIDNSHIGSPHSASKGAARNFGFGNKPSYNRFQKSQLHDMKSPKRYMKQPNKRGGRGQDTRSQNLLSTTSGEEIPTVCRRPLHVNYTKAEIQLWCQARKKNFPTRANVNMKLAKLCENSEDDDSKLRRQQLKEILAKQVELGVEVAEIPPSYLCEPDELVIKKETMQVTDGPSVNRFDKRRGKRQGRDKRHSNRGPDRDNWRSKRQKSRNKEEAPSVKREPSLLEKLLSADVKKDKIRLMQAFRFMVLNDFFKQWPAKPLEFPIVTVKDDELCESEIVGETILSTLDMAYSPTDEAEELKHESNEEHIANNNEVPDDTIDDVVADKLVSEEGEITD